MKRFILRLIIFVLPFALFSLAASIQAFFIGEAAPFSLILDWQKNSEIPLVYQPLWSRNQFFDYKLTAVAVHKPEIMVLGSSRVVFFRSAFANRAPELFYNAGIFNMSIEEIDRFFGAMLEQEIVPKVLIVGLDYPDYNAQRGDFRRRLNNVGFPQLSENLSWIYAGTKRTALQWFDAPQLSFPPQTEGYQLLGLQAFESNTGFLWDGSRFAPERNADDFAKLLEDDMQMFTNREFAFRGGSRLDNQSVMALAHFLELANANNVFVIGYLPPYRPSVWGQMQATGEYSYMVLAKDAIVSSFEQANFPFYDFTDPASIGGSEAEMTDSWHGMDLLNLRIYRELLARNPEILGQYSDSAVLDSWLTEYADTPLEQFSISLP